MDLLPTVKTPRTLVLMLAAVLLMATASMKFSTLNLSFFDRCRTIPGFRVNNVDPMALARGHPTIVALLSSNSSFSIRRVRRLERLHGKFQTQGIDVYMMIVDGGPRPAPGEDGVFENIVSFPVYHDDDNRTIWRQVFQGNDGNVFLIDRCGRETRRISIGSLGYMGLQNKPQTELPRPESC
ncbi:selenoprotein Pa-like isoform X2 [Babylonia areolata]|uniref:selenoprotein Pa-like isoform X2 n=1 Tax=Babylonia areolata TaxID=304850 RepID=UPI003FD004F8